MSKRSWLSSRKPGVAGADVVGREADARPRGRPRPPAQPADVLDRLALGQLEDDVAWIEPVADDHPRAGHGR